MDAMENALRPAGCAISFRGASDVGNPQARASTPCFVLPWFRGPAGREGVRIAGAGRLFSAMGEDETILWIGVPAIVIWPS